ncbi:MULTISPECIES: hypothetical protein [unclassified Lysobacter]|uniref:hypothetical protein n=1 Tax=unclassified Lysobacter TaxID=2635362 RepID=UPI001BE54618|nr:MULTISPECIES: hypothetical protein [unclassified Lysobacter]MBT2748340.1 hypothetical protein [Lysobacter sp. ISL-42]MBT2749893.1 hypothetical protein [Lysobacter sp. ISL-50]MBT2781221.1 hypothetical protein [Lysobacter sp. ISL-52]
MIALKVWATTVLAALAAVLAAFGWGRLKGARRAREQAEERIAVSEHKVAIAERVINHTEVRHEVDTDVLHLPTSDLPLGVPAAMAVVVADSAADRLYDDWSRDGTDVGVRVDAPDSGLSSGSTDRSDGPANFGP